MSKNRTQEVASRARKGAAKGTARRRASRPRQRTAAPQAAPAIAAHSLASLILPVRAGVEVFATMGGKFKEGSAERLVNDLSDSYLAAEHTWNGIEQLPADLFIGKTPAQQLAAITRQFSDRFCKDGTQFVVEEHDGRHCFTLCQYCDWKSDWNFIEVRHLIRTAAGISKSMEKLLYSFLKRIRDQWNLFSWFGGYMQDSADWVEQRIADNWEYDNPEGMSEDHSEYRSMLADLNSFRSGPAAAAAELICKAPDLTGDEILVRLTRLRKSHPLIDAMKLACDFLKQPYTVTHFDNPQCSEDQDVYENGIDAISFWEQNAMLWEYDDAVTDAWEEFMNCRFQESGADYPISLFRLKHDREDWDRAAFDASAYWPMSLIDVFTQLRNACDPVPSEQNLLINILA